jgi:hypothetical protein
MFDQKLPKPINRPSPPQPGAPALPANSRGRGRLLWFRLTSAQTVRKVDALVRKRLGQRGVSMAAIVLVPLDRPEAGPRPISARLRSQLVYFGSASGAPGVPELGEHEFWFAEAEVARWLDEGVFYLVSPLDSANQTEVELSEEQEALLNWLQTERVQHVRVEG